MRRTDITQSNEAGLTLLDLFSDGDTWATQVENEHDGDMMLCREPLGALSKDTLVYWSGSFVDAVSGQKQKLLFSLEASPARWHEVKRPGAFELTQIYSHLSKIPKDYVWSDKFACSPLGIVFLGKGLQYRAAKSDPPPALLEQLTPLMVGTEEGSQWVSLDFVLPKTVEYAEGRVSQSQFEFDLSHSETFPPTWVTFRGSVSNGIVGGRWSGPGNKSGTFELQEISKKEFEAKEKKTHAKPQKPLTKGIKSSTKLREDDLPENLPVEIPPAVTHVYFFDQETPHLNKASTELLFGPSQRGKFVFSFKRPLSKGPLRCSACDGVLNLAPQSVPQYRLFVKRQPLPSGVKTGNSRQLQPFDGEYFAANVWPLLPITATFVFCSNSKDSAAVFRQIRSAWPKAEHVNPATPQPSQPVSKWQFRSSSYDELLEMAIPLAVQNAKRTLLKQANLPTTQKSLSTLIQSGCSVQVCCANPAELLAEWKTAGLLRICECGGVRPDPLLQDLIRKPLDKVAAFLRRGKCPATEQGWLNSLSQLVKVRVQVPPSDVLAMLVKSGFFTQDYCLAEVAACTNPDFADPDIVEDFDVLVPEESLLRGVYGYGLEKPTTQQARLIQAIGEGSSVIFQDFGGSGKSKALCIGALKRAYGGNPGVKVLIVASGRELAEELAATLMAMAEYSHLKVACCVGGTSVRGSQRELIGADVVVGTVGRLSAMITSGSISLADRLLLCLEDVPCSIPSLDDLTSLLKKCPKGSQVVCTCTTLEDDDLKQLQQLNSLLESKPLVSTLRGIRSTLPPTLRQFWIEVEQDSWKPDVIMDILSDWKGMQVLIFVRTKREADYLTEKLTSSYMTASSHHGDIDQAQRDIVLKDFKSGASPVLICTDVLSFGLNLCRSPLVLNYNLPRSTDAYVHRCSRTARFGSDGIVVSLVSSNESSIFADIQQRVGPVEPMPGRLADLAPGKTNI